MIAENKPDQIPSFRIAVPLRKFKKTAVCGQYLGDDYGTQGLFVFSGDVCITMRIMSLTFRVPDSSGFVFDLPLKENSHNNAMNLIVFHLERRTTLLIIQGLFLVVVQIISCQ